jgi:uncharacterized membrane protein
MTVERLPVSLDTAPPTEVPQMKPALVFTVALMLFVVSGATAGMIYEIETTTAGSTVEQTQVFAHENKLKIESRADRQADPAHSIVYRGDRKAVMILDHQRKRYTIMDETARDRMAAQVNQAMAQYQEMLEQLPEEQRQMMRQMMGESMPSGMPKKPPTIEVKPTGDEAMKLGYPCRSYDVVQDGQTTQVLWVTDWKNIEKGQSVAGTFSEMGAFMQALGTPFQSPDSAAPGSSTAMSLMDRIDGFPIVTLDLDARGNVMKTSELRSVKPSPLNDGDFDPPEGYRRQDMVQP